VRECVFERASIPESRADRERVTVYERERERAIRRVRQRGRERVRKAARAGMGGKSK